MKKKLTKEDRKVLIKILSKKRASNVAYRNGYVSLKFDGKRLRDKVIIKHDPGLGDWSRKRNEVYYDEGLGKHDILPVVVHEVIEKYVTHRYGLKVNKESHRVALAIEKKFIADSCSRKFRKKCTHTGRCWRLHEARIQQVWEKEHEKIGRRRTKGKSK